MSLIRNKKKLLNPINIGDLVWIPSNTEIALEKEDLYTPWLKTVKFGEPIYAIVTKLFEDSKAVEILYGNKPYYVDEGDIYKK